ncbi:TVP38/TMEM64 family protein [Amphibacillus jilinensis]|uniref:TVP38/TMEM64 family protein n=1 Tax=Amphibacillus jilinensis TaxID=1216008 RepID=UPI0002E7C17E
MTTEHTITMEQVRELLETNQYDVLVERLLFIYEGFGPLPGILLPFIETFLPFLPLTVIVMTNAAAYGLLRGFLYSWIGESLGSIVVFLIIRRFRHIAVLKWIHTNRHVQRVTGWLERRGFGPLFLLLCFPFSPSSVINLVAALSKVSLLQFTLAILLGKTVMIFSLAYVGSSIVSFAEHPTRTILIAIGISLFWLLGKQIEKILFKKGEIDTLEKR